MEIKQTGKECWQWKKWTVVIMVMAAIAVMGQIRSATCATNATVDIVMSVNEIGVQNIGAASLSVSTAPNGTIVSPRAIFKNIGNTNENFLIRVATISGWGLVTSTASPLLANQFRLKAIWANWQKESIVQAHPEYFDTNDILTVDSQLSSNVVFWSDTAGTSNVGDPALDGGYNIPSQNERSVHFRFDAGGPGTTNSNTTAVTVTAQLP